MGQLSGRLKKIEQQLCISEKPSVVFEYTDEDGEKQKIEMLAADFEELLKEIDGKSRGLPINEEILNSTRGDNEQDH